MTHVFHAEQWLPYPIQQVFAFFSNPENLPRLMPDWQRPRIDNAVIVPPPDPSFSTQHLSLAAGAGSRMTLTFRPVPFSPVRLSWLAEISEFAWNDHFCDIQLSGPFTSWRHCHRLHREIRTDDSGVASEGTFLLDHVEYELPLGSLGNLANALFVRRQLAATFRFRHQRTAELLPLSTHP